MNQTFFSDSQTQHARGFKPSKASTTSRSPHNSILLLHKPKSD